MKRPKKSLQKLTDSKPPIANLLKLEQITPDKVAAYTEAERKKFSSLLTEKANNLKGAELDKFLKRIEPILSQDSKNELWEANHSKITGAISNLLREKGRMPSKVEIGNVTGLSRQTIDKHLKEYSTHPEYLKHLEQFRFMTNRVLTRLFSFAIEGDVKAAKVYLDFVGTAIVPTAQNTLIQNQNNYLQINGIVISQETLKNLKPEQLQQIEAIVKMALPGTEN